MTYVIIFLENHWSSTVFVKYCVVNFNASKEKDSFKTFVFYYHFIVQSTGRKHRRN